MTKFVAMATLPLISVFATEQDNNGVELSPIYSIDAIAGECAEGEVSQNWKYTAYLDISGKSGNSEEFGTQVGFNAIKDVEGYTAEIYGSYDRAEQESVKTSDETKLGASITGYMTKRLGVYLSIDAEKDDFESLDLRLVPSLGLAYRFFFEEDHKLTGKFGASYRYEDFTDGSTNKAWGLNLGLDHYWKFADWGKMTNEITYTPSVEDADEFLVEHDSGVNIPLGTSDNWSLRLGVSNTYNNDPLAGLKELDTTYYARLVVDWE